MVNDDDVKLKAEIDEIMTTVDAIMKRIEIACPPPAEVSSPHSG
jgi:hypothetical protein